MMRGGCSGRGCLLFRKPQAAPIPLCGSRAVRGHQRLHSANLLIPADLALSAARETAERVRWREFDCQLLHFCVAAMIRTHCRATILPSLRPSCDFSIVFIGAVAMSGKKSQPICQILYALPQSCCAATNFNSLLRACLFLAFLSHLRKS